VSIVAFNKIKCKSNKKDRRLKEEGEIGRVGEEEKFQ
jgi:hypothetical protein